jgi:anaerobic ribonucleoside-triphosphate reductase
MTRHNDDVTELREQDRTRCEVWTRVMGYHRPVSAFNPGKQSEYWERTPFVECRGAIGT